MNLRTRLKQLERAASRQPAADPWGPSTILRLALRTAELLRLACQKAAARGDPSAIGEAEAMDRVVRFLTGEIPTLDVWGRQWAYRQEFAAYFAMEFKRLHERDKANDAAGT
jgi:hypothetical protein